MAQVERVDEYVDRMTKEMAAYRLIAWGMSIPSKIHTSHTSTSKHKGTFERPSEGEEDDAPVPFFSVIEINVGRPKMELVLGSRYPPKAPLGKSSALNSVCKPSPYLCLHLRGH